MTAVRLEVPPPDEAVPVPLSDGEILHVRRYKNPGKPILALCHGNGFATDAYAPFWEPLGADFELCVFDLRHHGWNAPQDPSKTGLDLYADDLDHVVRAMRVWAEGAPVIGAFHSVSAITSLVHAAGQGTQLDALCLFDPPIQPPAGHALHPLANGFELKLAEWAGDRPDRYLSTDELSVQLSRPRSLAGWVQGAHDLMARSILRRDGKECVLACPPAVEAANYLANAALTSWDQFDRIDEPLALICADPAHPAGQSPAQVCTAIAADKDIPCRSIPGTTHMLQIEKPQECRDALYESLRNVAPGVIPQA